MVRRSYLLIASLIAVLALLATVALQAISGRAPMELIDEPKKLVELPPRGPDDWIVAQRAYPGEKIPFSAFEKAADETQALAEAARAKAPALAKAKWKSEGPRQVGGRVVDIAVDPNELNTVYAAVATGGVWKSTDAGLTFKPAWPRGVTLSMGALAIASDGTLYAGTGEANPGGGSIVYGGSGVYKSTNGGKSWKRLGLTRSGAIGRIAVDPNNDKKVYVASSGPLFQRGGQRGLYVTSNAGKSWKRVLKGQNGTTGAVDIAIDPEDSKRVFVSMWDHIRMPDLRVYGGTGSGLYRSTDGGKTFKRLGQQQGLPQPAENVGRIGVAVGRAAGPAPNPVYTIYIQTNGSFSEFYTDLTDGGDSFTGSRGDVVLSQSQATYGWWFGRIWVDPVDPLHVYAGGLFLGESFDGGQVFGVQAANIHPDHHAMAWDPQVPNRVYLGNDGGFYMSPSNGTPEASWVPATDMPWTQFYSVAVSQQDRTRITGGSQDNGSLRSYGLPNEDPFGCATWINCGDWNNFYGGDGEQNLINPKDHTNVFACYQYGICARSTNGGDTMTPFTTRTTSARRNWFTPLEFDPNNPQVMYYGGDIVNRSTDNGQTWQPISPILMKKGGRDTQYPYGTLTTIGISKKDPKTLLAGSDTGRIWRTINLKKWRRLRDDDLPRRWVTRVAIHSEKKKVMYASFSGYRSGSDDPHVSMSKNGGKSWKDITGKLPDAPVNDVFPKGKALYVATDVGVFVTKNNGRQWLRVGKGLPLAPITDITLQKKSESLFAATFGRGMFSVKLPKGF